MNIKKMVVAVITAISVLSLTACGKDEQPIINDSGAGNEQSNANSGGEGNSQADGFFGDNSTPDTPDEEPPKELGIWDILPEIPVTEESAFTYQYDSSLGGMVVTDYLKESPKVRIPDTLEGEPVVWVDFSKLKKELTELVMPESVNSNYSISSTVAKTLQYANISKGLVGKDMPNLVGVYIPNGVEEIGVFTDCQNLTNIVLPDSLTKIGYNAFQGCSSLTSIVIPNNVTTIGSGAFRDCSNLTSVVIPNNVTTIDNGAFSNCSNLTSINIPSGVTQNFNAGLVFRGCTSLTAINVDEANPMCFSVDGVLYGHEYDADSAILLLYCPKGKSGSVTVSDGVVGIVSGAFSECINLTDVKLPDSVRGIGIMSLKDDGDIMHQTDEFIGCTNIQVTYKGIIYDYEHRNDLYKAILSR